MKVVRNDERSREDISDAPIFMNGAVYRQRLADSRQLNFNVVGFAAGARNRFHTHTSDQILFVTSGRGIVATEEGQATVGEGDTVLIPAGEKHWHGATAESDFAHIAVTAAGSKTEIRE